MPQKRLRIFAGPNGSGKSVLSDVLKNHKNKKIKIGVFVNADEIEHAYHQYGFIDLKKYKLKFTIEELRAALEKNGLIISKLGNLDSVIGSFEIKNRHLCYNGDMNSYIAADLAAFIRVKLLENGTSFSFETVFSHESKLEFIEKAKDAGYKVYLYFITTQDPVININRVDIRVEKGGHPVPKDKIEERYYRAMKLLRPAIKACFRSYLFDNSGKHYELIAEVAPGNVVNVMDIDGNLPEWFVKYIYQN